MVKKSVSFLYIFVVVAASAVFAQSSAASANRRTAIRYLQLSKQYASEKLWNEADSNAKMGLAYDDKIADLWYLRAICQMNLGEKKSQVLPLVVTALTDAEWVDYNRDGARILYADILCSTRQFVQAIATLDSAPFIYSADAEYIRAKSYYCLGDTENIRKARSRLDSARRIYPADSRFAWLFYTHEYQFFRNSGFHSSSITSDVLSLADAFALTVPLYKNANEELEIYAAIFASEEKQGKSESKKVRMLKAFNSKGLKSPLYALEALKTGLLNEDTALDYFYQFSDKTVPVTILEDFAALLKTTDAKKEFAEYLNAYNGILTFDTDGDLVSNMTVAYKRGRPETITYDDNQDDESDWSASCDFGVPLSLSMSENALELDYSSWPYISTAKYKMASLHSDLKITLIAETLAWSPFTVEADSSIRGSLDFDFFVPVLAENGGGSISGQRLLRSALSYTIPSKERNGAVIQVSLLNGVAQIASYSVGEKIYAMAQFENGIPVSRKVDIDGDGLFETTEFYGFSSDFVGPDRSENYISSGDEMQIMTNLFGSPASGTGFYVKKITVDQNGDTIPDFTEEYLGAKEGAKIPGKISSWDTDGDGIWNVQYIKQPSSEDGIVREQSKFHYPILNYGEFSEAKNSSDYVDSIVTVFFENSLPVSVQIQKKDTDTSENLFVEKGKSKNFYWIRSSSHENSVISAKIEENIIHEINQTHEQGVSIIVEQSERNASDLEKNRFLAVRIEKLIFGMKISDEGISQLIKESEKKQ